MKKPSSLAQQVFEAQKILQTWPDSHRSSLRLEGSDLFLSKGQVDNHSQQVDDLKGKRKPKSA